MPKRDLSEAIFEAKDKERAKGSSKARKSGSGERLSLFKRRSFDTFYLFCVLLLFLAIIVQIVALAAFR